jgi:hypothetical protein
VGPDAWNIVEMEYAHSVSGATGTEEEGSIAYNAYYEVQKDFICRVFRRMIETDSNR